MAFVVAATWKAKPGEADRVRQVIEKMTPLSRAEEGNVFYQAQVNPEEPETFFLYEQYTDAQAYDIVYLLKQAMEKAGVTGDPSKLAQERTATRDALTGR